ncbi:MAG: bifunctional DNA-formamidopyrimidine glycosylase/DNA-(apurinic or apyrimidinic site) lyase [Negativicutes bacterium]|nr:bifunctional DNA-formamidopyrimidine glycosylase/DNA-(apurinic or apyrimidinic site) lyase [Negativicutes bacterium]
MPELPEVENIRRSLLPYLPSAPICRTEVLREGVIAPLDAAAFASCLQHKTIVAAKRRGKYLQLCLQPEGCLLIHLRMTGQLYWLSAERKAVTPLLPHTHVILHFADGSCLRYVDVRRFGKIRFWPAEPEDPGYLALGPEPLESDFNVAYLSRICQNRQTPIKSLLLDQHQIAGLGNIYADEALFRAGIHPLETAGNLKFSQIRRLQAAITEVLQEAVQAKGSSMRDYLDVNGNKGSFQEQWSVYRQTGKPCPICGSLIERCKVAGRSSHYCPHCQAKQEAQGLIIGLTGGIASGKSSVVQWLAAKGAKIVDTDAISHRITADQSAAVTEISEAFGRDVLLAPGVLNRRRLAELVFQDPAKLARLNAILHPKIEAEMQRQIHEYRQSKSGLPLVLDIPLLFEAGLTRYCDTIWLVWLDRQSQLQRLRQRDQLSEPEALARLDAQWPMEKKKALSDVLIDNSGSWPETENQLQIQWDRLRLTMEKQTAQSKHSPAANPDGIHALSASDPCRYH